MEMPLCLGVISVSNSGLLDYETSRRHRLIVIATTSDNNNAYDYATVWVNVVDINDHVPQFYQETYKSAVWENNQPHTFVLQVCSSSTAVCSSNSALCSSNKAMCRSNTCHGVDINEHVPQFYQERYLSALWENNQPHTFVL